MSNADERGSSAKRVTEALERSKKHPVVVVVLAVGAVIAFLFTTTDQITRISDTVSSWRNPHAAEYSALDSLDLDSRPEFFEDNFGRAKKALDLCGEIVCPEPVPESLRMYIHEAEGQITFAEALNVVGTEPTDVAIFMGPQSSAYAEVIAAGAPGRYRGLLLAWAPDGYGAGHLKFDVNAGRELAEMRIREAPYEAAALAHFRSATTPNTQGEFRDDGGYVGTLVSEASDLIALLYVGTEL